MAKKAVRGIVIKDQNLLVMKRNKFGMEYYTLVGGIVGMGEDTETALRRELSEEAGLQVGQIQLVFIEDGGAMYGVQYVYTCEYLGGEPQLAPDSDEALINALGQNIYEPLWLPLSEVPKVKFRSSSVQEAILEAVRSGFPTTPQTLAWKAETVPSYKQ